LPLRDHFPHFFSFLEDCLAHRFSVLLRKAAQHPLAFKGADILLGSLVSSGIESDQSLPFSPSHNSSMSTIALRLFTVYFSRVTIHHVSSSLPPSFDSSNL
jgi:hypothetical protein